MGAGRPRKTDAERVLAGQPPRASQSEARYAVEAPEKPVHVAANAVASAEWDRICPLLLEQRVLTPAFLGALVGYVVSFADLVRFEGLKAAPDFESCVTTPSGLKAHPAIKLANDAKRELRQWAAVLGLLPMTVTKVAQAPEAKGDTAESADDALLARVQRRAFGVVAGGRE